MKIDRLKLLAGLHESLDGKPLTPAQLERFSEKYYEKLSDDLKNVVKSSATIVEIYQTEEFEKMNGIGYDFTHKKIVHLLNQIDELNAEMQMKYKTLIEILEEI